MEILTEKTYVTVEKNFVIPTLRIGIQVEYQHGTEVIIDVKGRLKSSTGPVIGELISYVTKIAPQHFMDRSVNDKTISKLQTYYDLYLSLLPQQIEHIEIAREQHPKKDCVLSLEISCRYFHYIESYIQVIENHVSQFSKTISQSDWVYEYLPALNVGTYLLFELRKPDKISGDDEHNKSQEDVFLHIDRMEAEFRKGEWENVMDEVAEITEIIKHENEEPFLSFKNHFESVNKMPTEGIDELRGGLIKMFNVLSKFHHPRAKSGKNNPDITAYREDAYFAMTFIIGVVNMMFNKAKRFRKK